MSHGLIAPVIKASDAEAEAPRARSTSIAPSPQGEAPYPDEMNRWVRLLGIPMLAACACVALAFGTRYAWFYAGAIAFGPGLGVLAIIYLALTSDTNNERAPEIAETATPSAQASAAA